MRFLNQLFVAALVVFAAAPAFAADGGGTGGTIAMAAALAIGIAAFGGALAQGYAVAAALQGLSRNPEANVTAPMIIGLALIESLVIYALVVAIMLQGKIG